jgi:hypothetical protein
MELASSDLGPLTVAQSDFRLPVSSDEAAITRLVLSAGEACPAGLDGPFSVFTGFCGLVMTGLVFSDPGFVTTDPVLPDSCGFMEPVCSCGLAMVEPELLDDGLAKAGAVLLGWYGLVKAGALLLRYGLVKA